MKPTLKRLGVAAATAVALLAMVPLLFEGAIGERAVEALRAQLRTDLSVGGTSLSLLRDFPYASVSLTDVHLDGYGDEGGGASGEERLLEAARLSGRISYYDLLFAEGWVVNTVRLEDATLRVHRGADKVGNWSVFAKAGGGQDSARDVRFALSRILLDEVEVYYVDLGTETDVHVHVASGSLSGDFGSEAYTLEGVCEGLSHHVTIGERAYVRDMSVAADLELRIQPRELLYTFKESTITLDEMPVDVSGTIGLVKGSTSYDLALATDEGRLGALLRALPPEWVTPAMRELESRGAFRLEGTVAGLYDARHAPAIDFAGHLRDGSLLVPALGRKATGVSFRLDFTNGEARSMADSRLALTAINAELDGQPLNGAFAWRNFDDPYYEADVTGTLPLAWLDELWPAGSFEGELGLRSVQLAARQRHLVDASAATQVRMSGRLEPRGVALRYGGERIGLDADEVALADGAARLTGGRVRGLDNAFALELNVDGLVPYLLGDAAQVLDVRGEIATEHIDLDRWVALLGASDGAEALTPKGTPAVSDNPTRANGFAARLKLRADRVLYGDVRGKRFTGTCTLADSELGLVGEGYAMEGHWSLDGVMSLRARPSLTAKLGCSEVNITELFEQTANVGQDVVGAENLEGQMTARVFVEADWDAAGELDYDGLHVWANVGLVDGALRDFEMLQALSKYVRADELRDVRFTDVENWIEVEGSSVYLPAMFIQSTATNFTVAGEHSFAHDIDYSVRVNGAQVLLTKLFGKRSGIDFLPDRRGGWVKTGFKIDGRLEGDDYDVRMAGAEVRKHFRHSQRRKGAIRRKLIALFGAESLIDDYDDEGVRIAGRPQRSRAAVRTSRPPLAARREARPTDRAPRRPVDVDTETYLEDFAEEQTAGRADDEAILDAPRAALSGVTARTEPAPPVREAKTPTPPVAVKPPTRAPRPAPGEFEDDADGEDGEYMEGFDDIVIPDRGGRR